MEYRSFHKILIPNVKCIFRRLIKLFNQFLVLLFILKSSYILNVELFKFSKKKLYKMKETFFTFHKKIKT